MMRSRRYAIVLSVLGFVLLLSCASPVAASPVAPAEVTVSGPSIERIAGNNRYDTAVEISKKGWTASDVVVVATGQNFPDALAGAPLAAAHDAPLLLSQTSGLPASVSAEVTRLGATTAYVLGAEAALGANVVIQLKAAGVTNVIRIKGANRYDTAAKIAEEVVAKRGPAYRVVIAAGENFPDALAVGGFAGANGYPILLVQRTAVPQATAQALASLASTGSIVVGGPAAVSDAVVGQLPAPERVSGANRYETAARISEYAFQNGATYSRVAIATGKTFPDALGAGAWLARVGGVLVLTDPATLSSDTDDFIRAHCSSIDVLSILGGEPAVSSGVVSAARTASETRVSTRARVLTSTTASALSTVTASGHLIFNGTAGQLADFAVGDFIVSGPTEAAENGLLRKVTSISRIEGLTVVEAEQAQLEDVVQKGSVDIAAPLEPAEPEGPAPPSLGVASGAFEPAWELKGKQPFLDRTVAVTLSPEPAYIALEGKITITGGYYLNIQIDNWQLQEFTTKLSLDASSALQLHAKAKFKGKLTQDVLKVDLPRVITFIGPVPFTLGIRVDLETGVSAELEGDLLIGGKQGLTCTYGAQYKDGTWTSIKEEKTLLEVYAPKVKLTAQAKAWIAPRVELRFYEATGLYSKVDGYVRGEVDVFANPWWKLWAGFDLDVGLGGTEIWIFKITKPQSLFKKNLLDVELANAGGPFVPDRGNAAGTVLDGGTDLPMSGVDVTAFEGVDPPGDLVAADTTDAGGAYEFDAIPVGDYTLRFMYGDGTIWRTEMRAIIVAKDETVTTDVVMHLIGGPSEVGSIAGTVASTSGTPLIGATVTLADISAPEIAIQTATTDEAGDYTFAVVPEGSYVLTFVAAGYTPYSTTVAVQADAETTADAALESSSFSISQITDDLDDQRDVCLSGARLAWLQVVEIDGIFSTEIFTWTAATGAIRVTDNTDDEQYLCVSGDRLAWAGSGGLDGGWDDEIFTWTPTDGVVQLTQNTRSDRGVRISGDRLVWASLDSLADGADYEVMTWTPIDGAVRLTDNSGDDDWPSVSGDRVAWRGERGADNGTDDEVFTWTPSEGHVQVTSNAFDDGTPEVSGDRLVWQAFMGDEAGFDDEIFTWTAGDTEPLQLTDNTTSDTYPQVSGDRVVWLHDDGGLDGGFDDEIHTWTPSGGVVAITANDFNDYRPRIDGDRVVWHGTGGDWGESQIYTWTPAGGLLSLSTTSAQWPQVSGNRIAWQGFTDDGDWDGEVFLWGPDE